MSLGPVDVCLVLVAEVMAGVDEQWVRVWCCLGGVRAVDLLCMARVVGSGGGVWVTFVRGLRTVRDRRLV